MPVQFSHKNIRDLAKALRELTGREIQHTQIISAIAASVGRKPDAMMHELKNEAAPALVVPNAVNTPEAAASMARAAGFDISDYAGCVSFGKVLREVDTPDQDRAFMDVAITIADHADIHIGPFERVWQTFMSYQDPTGSETFLETSSTGMTLPEAITAAEVFAEDLDKHWDKHYSEKAINDYIARFRANGPR